jgi:hypothetical protein
MSIIIHCESSFKWLAGGVRWNHTTAHVRFNCFVEKAEVDWRWAAKQLRPVMKNQNGTEIKTSPEQGRRRHSRYL